jgi:hypothetical protein
LRFFGRCRRVVGFLAGCFGHGFRGEVCGGRKLGEGAGAVGRGGVVLEVGVRWESWGEKGGISWVLQDERKEVLGVLGNQQIYEVKK